MPENKRFTELTKCGHCQNHAPMEIVASHANTREYIDDGTHTGWEAGPVYELVQCPACERITLRDYFWNEAYMDGSDIEYTVLYPAGGKGPRGLPIKIESSYQAAQKVRNIDANAYGVLLGRVLELVCEDRNASGTTLDNRLKSLAKNGEIPEKLVAVAAGLRRLRNIGAHATLGELTEAELPVLDDLTRAILEYVYSAPWLAREAEEHFTRLEENTSERNKKAEPEQRVRSCHGRNRNGIDCEGSEHGCTH